MQRSWPCYGCVNHLIMQTDADFTQQYATSLIAPGKVGDAGVIGKFPGDDTMLYKESEPDSSSLAFDPTGKLLCATVSRFLPILYEMNNEVPLALFDHQSVGQGTYSNLCTVKVCLFHFASISLADDFCRMEVSEEVETIYTTPLDRTTLPRTSGKYRPSTRSGIVVEISTARSTSRTGFSLLPPSLQSVRHESSYPERYNDFCTINQDS